MSLEEYIQQEWDQVEGFRDAMSEMGRSILNSGDIVLGGNPAYKVVVGVDGDPTVVKVSSIKGTRLYTIEYSAHPSDYHTYLPGVQKIVDSFKMLVS